MVLYKMIKKQLERKSKINKYYSMNLTLYKMKQFNKFKKIKKTLNNSWIKCYRAFKLSK